MLNTVDLFLGSFLILCGFSLSLFNLKRVVMNNTKFSSILLSENVLLMCVGVAFMFRALHELNMVNAHTYEMEERAHDFLSSNKEHADIYCGFSSLLMTYGPLIVSLVNSFLSLIIDNYMHYRMLQEIKIKDDENVVEDIAEESITERRFNLKGLFTFWKKYFSYIIIALQWIVPVLFTLAMYTMSVKEMGLPISELRNGRESCMALINYSNYTCSDLPNNETNFPLELRKYVKPSNYLHVYEDYLNNDNRTELQSIVQNIYKIISNITNDNFSNVNVTSGTLFRTPKSHEKCMKICYVDNKNLLTYMFVLAILSFFVPITISTVILTKIHVMDVKRDNVKTYVSRELLYNILFWTPVMLDTFLSLILCSYTTNGVMTSMFNIIANIYQAIKNFMNTKYFKDNNAVMPI